MRRPESQPKRAGVKKVGGLTVDPARRSASVGAKVLGLTPREFDILHTLMRSPGEVFSRERLIDSVWEEEVLDRRNIDAHVSRLREKLEEDPSHPVYLLTKWGAGYYINEAP